MIIDLNYLGHKFSIKYSNAPYKYFDYQCKKCKVLVWYDVSDGNYSIIDSDLQLTTEYLNNTCDEMIVKNILE